MPLNKITVTNPSRPISCPGCGDPITYNKATREWSGALGQACEPPGRKHSHWIDVTWTEDDPIDDAEPGSDIEALAASTAITEQRTAMLDLMRKRLTIDHSITLHRDAASAADVRAMLDHLERAGMPPEATLKVDVPDKHTRMWARWAEETR